MPFATTPRKISGLNTMADEALSLRDVTFVG